MLDKSPDSNVALNAVKYVVFSRIDEGQHESKQE
jgi:hypothetical protein